MTASELTSDARPAAPAPVPDVTVAAVADALLRERTRLADVLHDEVLQHLCFARQELLEHPGAEATGDPLAFLDTAIAVLRDELRRLSGADQQRRVQGPLAEEVREVAEHAARVGRFELLLDLPEALDVPEAVARVVGQAARELLANVVKHAAARRVAVAITATVDGTELTVVDDGCGVDMASAARRAAEGHLGLTRLRRRIEASGGTLEIAAGHDGGTSARVRFPR